MIKITLIWCRCYMNNINYLHSQITEMEITRIQIHTTIQKLIKLVKNYWNAYVDHKPACVVFEFLWCFLAYGRVYSNVYWLNPNPQIVVVQKLFIHIKWFYLLLCMRTIRKCIWCNLFLLKKDDFSKQAKIRITFSILHLHFMFNQLFIYIA